ncbi:MAG: dihydrofolate reductase [Pseudomonadota bacterium]|nr:dihydrofolate reductase [Pseudomonadota bacterium]
MTLSLIVAMAKNGVIGRGDALPWHIPEDLKHFKSITMGKPIIMGRRTWDSLGRILPGRPHIVLSRDPNFAVDGVSSAHTLEDALTIAESLTEHEIMIIGGAEIYRAALCYVNCIYLTEIHRSISGDTFFPRFNRDAWIETERQGPFQDEQSGLTYSFVTLLQE